VRLNRLKEKIKGSKGDSCLKSETYPSASCCTEGMITSLNKTQWEIKWVTKRKIGWRTPKKGLGIEKMLSVKLEKRGSLRGGDGSRDITGWGE